MDPFTWLVLIGLAGLGGAIVAAAFSALLIAAFFVFMVVFAITACIIGAIGDARYNKKMVGKQVPYRLPFYYRWKGWQVGGVAQNDYGYKNGMFFDHRVNKIIPMFRALHASERR